MGNRIDLYWPGRLDGCAEPARQREAFARHIDLAKRVGKPLMIHNRDGDDMVLDVLRAEGAPDAVIFHCFVRAGDGAGVRRRRLVPEPVGFGELPERARCAKRPD